MGETSATKTLRAHLVAHGAHVQRIEDKLTPGIPDTNVCLRGVEMWLEGKFLKDLPARDDTLIRFGAKGEPRLIHQANWLDARRKAGGLTFWWVRVRDGGWYLFDSHFSWLKDGVSKSTFLTEEAFASAKAMTDAIADLASRHARRN